MMMATPPAIFEMTLCSVTCTTCCKLVVVVAEDVAEDMDGAEVGQTPKMQMAKAMWMRATVC